MFPKKKCKTVTLGRGPPGCKPIARELKYRIKNAQKKKEGGCQSEEYGVWVAR